MKHEQIDNARCANDTTCTHTDLIVAAIDRLTQAVLFAARAEAMRADDGPTLNAVINALSDLEKKP